MSDRKEITLDELRSGPNVSMSDIEVSGMVVIKDKDGNIKSELEIVSLEVNEDK